ncbi:MAG TPA: hypothetical protein VG053_04410 [Solirubrobacteraceae bacterium]|jgi:hypothetical protein|nr:hypothetical protein [Solirubrobacteraceae bacterium]
MFHVELRQFPHNACAFNLTDAELSQIVEPWSRDEWIELGERKWSPHQARLTVLEGPHLPIEDLAMGRGWRNAQHQSQDVTERVIAQALASAPAAPASGGTVAVPRSPDTELQPLLGSDPGVLLQAWRLAAERRPELSPSESLALAESTLSSLDSSPS